VSCLKSLVSAASQYRNNTIDDNLVRLLRELDVSSTAVAVYASLYTVL